MDMTNDCRLWARHLDVRSGLVLEVGSHVIVGDEGADPKVARVLAVDDVGHIELQVVGGAIDEYRALLARA